MLGSIFGVRCRAACAAFALAWLGAGCGKSGLRLPSDRVDDRNDSIGGFDTGTPAQEGPPPQGGPPPGIVPFDAGMPPVADAGTPADAAPPRDAGTTVDAGPPRECAPGLTRCNDMRTPAFCNDRGQWQTQPECGNTTPVCRFGRCVDCGPEGTMRCGPDGQPQYCDNFGRWYALPECRPSERCMDGRCACVPDPTPTRCRTDSPTPQYCDDSGTFRDAAKCDGATPVCLFGQCVQCEPGPIRCAADGTREYCDQSGSPAVETCPAATTCIDGDCRRAVLSASMGFAHSCAILDDHSLKCWGAGGLLGLEDGAPRGLSPHDMGDALPRVDLGAGRSVLDVGVGQRHACALLDGGDVKCWGENSFGQLGLGDTETRGADPGTMGDALPAVDLGAGHSATAIAVGLQHTCAVLDDATLKCWGGNEWGELGLGDAEARGDQPAEMGDALPAVDLGTGRTVKAVVAGAMTCALLDNDRVKCWGNNDEAILGLGYRGNSRGDQPGEMGDSLPAIDLGTGRTATALSLYAGHTCARLDNGQSKCWGFNQFGQVGIGSATDVGDEPGEMGDTLPALDLGTGHSAIEVVTGAFHTCAVLEDASVKCWGFREVTLTNDPSDPASNAVGDEPGEMGDALPVVDLGTGAKVLHVYPSFIHTCALLESGQLKCWGTNTEGQLGLGVGEQLVGDTPDEMGDALPTVDLGR